jgi:ribosomal protein L40E
MFSPKCLFCGHGNPADAKFCNECASPLHLKPCNECDAINDRSAESCYKCGADFPIKRMTIEAAPTSAEDFGPAAVSGFEQKRQRLHRPAPDPVDTLQHRVRREARQVIAKEMEFFAHERPLAAAVTPSFPASQRTPQIFAVRVRETRARRYLVTRVALPTLLIVGVAIAGLLAYRHQAQVENAVNANQAARANGDATRTPASVGVSPRSDGSGASSAAAGATAPVAAPTEDATSPMTQGRIRTTGTHRPEDETSASVDSAPAVPSSPSPPAGIQIAPGTALAAPTDPVTKATRAAKSIATQSHDKPLQTPARRSVATPSGSIESTSTFPDADALAVRAPIGSRRDEAAAADRERLRSCTEEVAALGLCTGGAAANREMK